MLHDTVLMHYALAISVKINKFSYFIFKILFQMIIDQTYLKLLSNLSIVVCNLNAKNNFFNATKFINERIFNPQFHIQLHIDHITTSNQSLPTSQSNLFRWHISRSQHFKRYHDVIIFNVLHTTKAKCFRNTIAFIRLCPILSRIISTSWNHLPYFHSIYSSNILIDNWIPVEFDIWFVH